VRRSDAGQREPGVPCAEPAGSVEPWATLGERELVLAMRRDEPEAFTEFVARYHALLIRHARAARVGAAEQDAVVLEVLGDVAERLTSPGARIPRSLAAYLVASLKHRLLNSQRDAARHDRLREQALAELDTHHERAILSTCSEASLRASRGAAWEAPVVRPAMARLAAALDRVLTDDERRLVAWVGQHVPQHRIAEWLGVSQAAVAKRIARLRARLRRVAFAYVATQEPAEQRELQRFFRRLAQEEDR
jgi:RNA polymerase sigma factor (sigma-70 family)